MTLEKRVLDLMAIIKSTAVPDADDNTGIILVITKDEENRHYKVVDGEEIPITQAEFTSLWMQYNDSSVKITLF